MSAPTVSRLPSLIELLDPAAVLARLAPIADARGVLVGAAPFHLRWKPGASALLGVRLSWHTADGVAETLAALHVGDDRAGATAWAHAHPLLEPPLGPAIAELDDMLFIAFPNDRLLRGLRAVTHIRRVGRQLAESCPRFESRAMRVRPRRSSLQPVRWTPGRRAVVEMDLRFEEEGPRRAERWHAFARIAQSAELTDLVARWDAAAEVPELEAPAVEFVDRDRAWFATAVAPGRALDGVPGMSVRSALRAALAGLHAAPSPELRTREESEERDAALHALEELSSAAPALEARAYALGMRIVSAYSSLARCTPVFTHGELGAEQLHVDGSRLSVNDWDEAANGDPHLDHAWLAADLRGRGLETAWVESLARQVLGDRFDAARFAWQRAAAEARRAVEGLHRCRADWRARALDRLEAAEHALELVPEQTTTTRGRGVSTWLTTLLDPELRRNVPGLLAGNSRVVAVWPGSDGGAIVGLAREREPAQVVRWLRIGDHVEAFDFPWDPGLPALAPLLATGRFRIAGHRFGKRAALRETGGARFLFLRPEGVLDRAYARVRDAHRRLSEAGVCSSRPLGLATEAPAWWAEAIQGRPLEPWRERDATWRQFGATLARAHSAHGGASVPAGGLAASLAGGRRQVALVRLADPELADELDLALDLVPANLSPGHAAYIHGDLHPLQVVIGEGLVILDWERARVGEAEEDLGNLFAHLAWEAGSAESRAREGILEGYAEAGGCLDSSLMFAHARASLARVRAVHSWRDGCAERARDGAIWHAWLEELAP